MDSDPPKPPADNNLSPTPSPSCPRDVSTAQGFPNPLIPIRHHHHHHQLVVHHHGPSNNHHHHHQNQVSSTEQDSALAVTPPLDNTSSPLSLTTSASALSSSPLITSEQFSNNLNKKLRLEIKSEPQSQSGTGLDMSLPSEPAPATASSSSSSSRITRMSAMRASHSNELESWQESKRTIKDRTSCLVNSERLSDVTFLVGQNEVPVYGHKTILSVGSPYFEKLFFGPMAETKSQINIPDMEPEIFLTFLKYLYTDEFDNTMDDTDTLQLLKPAKVYIVPHLAEKCTALLIERMNPENVLVIYNRALVFDESKLAEFCLKFVDRQIDKIITTENFLLMEPEILCTLLDRDNLRIDECTLFKAVVKWTEMECARQDLEFTRENARSVLGRALYLLRFPTMAQEEFCIEVVPTDILNKDEIIGIFMNLCITSKDLTYRRPETPFRSDKRVFRPKLHYLNRFSDVLSKVLNVNNSFGATSDVLYSSKLRFETDQRVFIHGIGIYGISSPIPNIRFSVTASLCKTQHVLGSKTQDGSGRSYDFRIPFQIMFDKPVEVVPDEEVLLTACLKIVRDSLPNSNSSVFGPTFGSSNNHYGATVNIDSYYGMKAHSQIKITCNDAVNVTFTFHVPSCYHIGETFSLGQIPQIIFSV